MSIQNTCLLTTLLILQQQRALLDVGNYICSNSLSLCTQQFTSSRDNCTVVIDDTSDQSLECNSISFFLEHYKSVVGGSDCLQVNLYPGTYTFSDYLVKLNYSVILRAPEGRVNISCETQCLSRPADPIVDGSPLWFLRDDIFTSTNDPSPAVEVFFVQLEGIDFQNCQRPVQMDNMDYVGISHCSFAGFEASAVDVFNCQNVTVKNSVFSNCTATNGKERYRGNSGGLSIAYHTNRTVFHDSSLLPSVCVTDCTFNDNKALLPGENTQQQINAALNRHFYYGRGGGLGLYLDEFFINITLNVERNRFENNFAHSFGGGLYVNLDGNATQHSLNIKDCNFTDNRVGGGFGGAIQIALLTRNANSEPSQLKFVRCTFTRNSASFGGGLSVVQTYSLGSGNQVSLMDSYFESNCASDVGGAVLFASLLYVQNRKASYHYQVSNNMFFNNTSPGGTFGAGFIHQNFTGHNQFLNNTGPGLRIVGSQILAKGNLSFIGNNAQNYEGGAVYISSFGQIQLYRGTELNFVNNIGRIGSSIVVEVQRSPEVFSPLIFNTQCFLTFEDTSKPPEKWNEELMNLLHGNTFSPWENFFVNPFGSVLTNYVKVRFSGNRAVVGPALYISYLNHCSWFSSVYASNISNQVQSNFSTTHFTMWPVFECSDSNNMATSQPNGDSPDFYFQTEATTLTSHSTSGHTIAAYPGQELQLSLVGVDQFQHATYMIARVSDIQANISSGAFSQATEDDSDAKNSNEAMHFEPALIPVQPGKLSVDVLYRVPVSIMSRLIEGQLIRVVIDAPYNVRDPERLELSLSFKFCLPGYKLSRRVEGDDFLTCTCLDSTFNILACNSDNNIIVLRDGLWAGSHTVPDPQLNFHTCPLPYCQCTDQNSVTCDNLFYQEDKDTTKQCHGLRKGTLCGQCVNGTGVGVLRFNCRYCDTNYYWTIPLLVVWDTLVCVLIFVVLVRLRSNSMKGLLFYIQMLYLGSILGLYYPWDFCLFPGMSALVSFAPRFIPFSIATSVSVVALLAVFCCTGKRVQRHIWHGVWTLVLLIYAPLAYTCIILLVCPSLPSAQGGAAKPRWYLDGEVECFTERTHIILGLLAIFLLSLLIILPIAIFLFTFFAPLPRTQTYRPAELIYQALSAGYCERTRWWGAWDLARRLLLIGVVIVCPGRSVVGLYIVIPAFALHLFFLPYTKWWQNVLEALILANYILLLLLRSTQTILDDLSTYSGTTVPQSRGTGLPDHDTLTFLFSFFYYIPVVTAIILLTSVAVITLAIKVQSKRSRSNSATRSIRYSQYDETVVPGTGNKAVTVTHVSL